VRSRPERMLWPADRLFEVFKNIRAGAGGGGCTVVVYVALDCDALCACRIVTGLLKADNVPFKLVSVHWQDEILADYKETSRHDVVRSIIMINCGGDMDVQEAFNLTGGTFCYLIDCNRPLNHANILPSRDHAIVLSDDHMDYRDMVLYAMSLQDFDEDDVQAILTGSQESDEEHEDKDEEEDVNDGVERTSDNGGFVNGTNKENNSNAEEEEEEDEFEFMGDDIVDKDENKSTASNEEMKKDENATENSEEEPVTKKRKVSELTEEAGEKKMEPGDKTAKVKEYYNGSTCGTPASYVMLAMAQQVSKEQKLFIWLAIVGTTFHFVNSRITEETYDSISVTYKDLVRDRASGLGRATEDGAFIPNGEEDQIFVGSEFKLILHRHWSLFQAFANSEYTATRMAVWQEQGEKALLKFFAKMGISRKDSEQKFSFLQSSTKAALADKIAEHGPGFAVDEDFFYDSFNYRSGYRTALSAADAVHCIDALLRSFSLQSDATNQQSNEDAVQETGDIPSFQSFLEERNIPLAGKGDDGRSAQHRQKGFSVAYDFLDFSSNPSYEHFVAVALELSRNTQLAVLKEGSNIMAGNKITSVGAFRYHVLDQLAPKLAALFTERQVLMTLARFIMFAHTARKKWRGDSAKPLILGAVGPLNDYIHFVGLPCIEMGEVEPNPFGRFFRAAASKAGLTFRHNGFNSPTIQIGVEHKNHFFRALYGVMAE